MYRNMLQQHEFPYLTRIKPKKEQNISFFHRGYYTNSRKLRVVFFIFLDKNRIEFIQAFVSATTSFNMLLLFFMSLFTIEFDELDLTE